MRKKYILKNSYAIQTINPVTKIPNITLDGIVDIKGKLIYFKK
jgi:hypothetical protein